MEKKTEKSRGLGAQIKNFLFNLLTLVILGLIAWYIIFKSGWFTEELKWLHNAHWLSSWFSWWWFIPLVLIILFIFGIKAVFSPSKKEPEKKKPDEEKKPGDETKKDDEHHHDEKKSGWAYAWDTFWTAVINTALMIGATIVVLFLIIKGCILLTHKLHEYTHGSEQTSTVITYTETKTELPTNVPIDTNLTHHIILVPGEKNVELPALESGQHYEWHAPADIQIWAYYPKNGEVKYFEEGPGKAEAIIPRQDGMTLTFQSNEGTEFDVFTKHN